MATVGSSAQEGAKGGLLGGPAGMGIGVGVGLLSHYLGANAQKGFFNEMQKKLEGIRSQEHLDKLYASQRRTGSPFLADLGRAADTTALSTARSISGAGRRRGFGSVASLQASGAAASVHMNRRATESAFAIEQMKMARAQQDSEARDVAMLLGTPYGAVSPGQAALAGGGAGMEAVNTARYFETLAGREDTA